MTETELDAQIARQLKQLEDPNLSPPEIKWIKDKIEYLKEQKQSG